MGTQRRLCGRLARPSSRPLGRLRVNDPLISRFAHDCGATAPLSLRVESNGGVLAEGTVHQPFTLLGRDDACDVTLTDPDVNLRHAWLQVLGGRPFLIDLGSRTGLVWPTGNRPHGWLDVGTPVNIGPFQFTLRSGASAHPTTWPVGFNPLRADPEATWNRPAVGLEFRNGRRPRDRWPVNRMITLIGRSPECKIHLNSDDISSYHCGLVLTTAGLWVVDLSGRGVVVDGERMRVAPLRHASELWVGRFLIACVYPSAVPTPALAVPSPVTITPATPLKPVKPTKPTRDDRPFEPTREGGQIEPIAGMVPGEPSNFGRSSDPTSGLLSAASLLAGAAMMGDRNPKLANLLPEDEVPLGVAPTIDAGLPSSHIMADAFEALKKALADKNASVPSSNGPVSGVISLSGTLTPPPMHPNAVANAANRSGSRSGIPAPVPPKPAPAPDPPPIMESPTSAGALVLPLLKQLGDVHGQMFEQFQQSMLLMVQMFGQMHRDQMTQMQQELIQIQELNAELAKLQTEVARLAMMQAFSANSSGSSGSGTRLGIAHDDTPQPVPSPLAFLPGVPSEPVLNTPEGRAAMQNYVVERISALQEERQTRWQKLVGYVTAKPEKNPA